MDRDRIARLQQDEVESIRSIYPDIFRDLTSAQLVWNRKQPPHFQLALSSSVASDRPTISLCLDIRFTATYPSTPPTVRVLNPRNIVKDRIAAIETRISDLIKEYPQQEVSFIIISEIIIMLDEFQLTTEKALSLEQEREERLRLERLDLERREASQSRKLQDIRKIQDAELVHQLLKIRDEYDGPIEPSAADQSLPKTPEALELVSLPANSFVFDHTITLDTSHAKTKITFKAVRGSIKLSQVDILAPISQQYVVAPVLDADHSEAEQLLLLSRIELRNLYWDTDEGKKNVQDLELELELASSITHTNVLKLFGFQIDKLRTGPGWTLHLLTEFEVGLDSLQDILSSAEYVKWALARKWLIQVLPVCEYLHNAGFSHKLICPQLVFLYREGHKTSRVPEKTLKLAHPSYGFKLLYLLTQHPNESNPPSPLDRFLVPAWTAPELKSNMLNHQQKTDIWDLGVLFLRIMFGLDAVYNQFRSPQEFHAEFARQQPSASEYSLFVYDLLSKMLCPKLSKRASPLDLNATSFLRDGPVLGSRDTTDRLSVLAPPKEDGLPPTNRAGVASSRRYSNQNAMHDFKVAFPPASSQSIGRYHRDFEEVGRIGKGGFGEVYKVRSRMEGTFYAVKKVKHRSHKLDSLLTEVLSLARLNHQYIVRYYGTWVEQVSEHQEVSWESDSESESQEAELGSNLNTQLSSFLTSKDNSLQVDYVTHSFDNDIEFAFSSSDEDEFDDRIVFGNLVSNAALSTNSTSLEESKRKDVVKIPVTFDQKSILYIQMEFCENNTLLNLIEQGLPNNKSEYWRLFRQLLEAVSYIHREGFIHRDLKPMNIFIDRLNNVKVGDFGLAKNSQFSLVVSTNNQVSPERSRDLSTLVGTVFYTANEVSTGNYNEKVDMYSLGIILFEMCYPLSTGMERARTLNNLRLASIEFPSDFTVTRYHTEKKIIEILLNHDPQKRLSCSELLLSGWLPVEHQDEVIKEALRSLADPASPWQQQVRQTLFEQPYLLAKDLMYDNSKSMKSAATDTINHHLFSTMVRGIFDVFRKHGAVEEYSSDVLLPRTPLLPSDTIYQVLDKSGQVLCLTYDLVLPHARFLSKNCARVSKTFRHQFVYRSNLRGAGNPDSYSAVSFEVCGRDAELRHLNDAECLKVVDELLELLPCFKAKSSQTVILVNHYDIIDAIISFAFGNIGITERKRTEVMAVVSQLGIDKNADEIKRLLKDNLQVPHTVTKDLVDGFDFCLEPLAAIYKMRKLMVDSPHLIKVERAFKAILHTFQVLQSMNIAHQVQISPLANYNSQYYKRGIMFQALFRVDRARKFARIVTGGRYDTLVTTLANKDVSKAITPHAVGFTMPVTFIFMLMRNLIARRSQRDFAFAKWRGVRCELLVVVPRLIAGSNDIACRLLSYIWKKGVSGDFFFGSADEAIDRARTDGIPWLVFLKQSSNNAVLNRQTHRAFKPFRARNVLTLKDADVDDEGLVDILIAGREARTEIVGQASASPKHQDADDSANRSGSVDELDPLFAVDIDQKVVIAVNDAPKGRKSVNKRGKWEVENDAKIALAQMLKQLASSTIVTVDARDEVLDMISVTSIHQTEEWVKKIIFVTNNMPKSYILNIHSALMKEFSRGQKWAVVCSPKTQKTAVVDLQR